MLLSFIVAQVLAVTPSTGQMVPISATTCSAGQFVVSLSTSALGGCAVITGPDIASGTINPDRLGSGGAAGRYLRYDSTWQPLAGGGDLLAANNLSDVANAGTSRTNLGLAAMAQVASVTLTGDVTGSGTSSFAATIANDAVTNAKAANMANATFKCRTTAGTGDPEDCTVAQSKALLGVPVYVLLTANRTNATTSYADITDLIIPVSANTRYDIECRFIYSANATTTGIGIGWTGPASPTLVGGLMTSGLTAATVGGTTSVGNDTGGVTTASVATSGNFATFKGIWSNGANSGNVQMRFKSEVAIASAIIIQAGSYCKYNTF